MADSRDLLQEANVNSLEDLYSLPIERTDVIAKNVHDWAIASAAAEGGATGLFGIFGIPADIPAIITLALRTIHKVGLCYGYEMETEQDFQFTYAILSSSSANSMEEKIAALATLRSFQMVLIRQTWQKMAQTAAQRTVSKEGALISLRTLAKQLGINITKRRALAAIPIIGAVVGASVNAWYMKDVGVGSEKSFSGEETGRPRKNHRNPFLEELMMGLPKRCYDSYLSPELYSTGLARQFGKANARWGKSCPLPSQIPLPSLTSLIFVESRPPGCMFSVAR